MDRSASKASVINLDDTIDSAHAGPVDCTPGSSQGLNLLASDQVLVGGIALSIPEDRPESGVASPQVELVSGVDNDDGHIAVDHGQLMQDVITQLESQCIIQDSVDQIQPQQIIHPSEPSSIGSGLEGNWRYPETVVGSNKVTQTAAPAITPAVPKKPEAIQDPQDRRKCAWIPSQKTAHTLQTSLPHQRLSYTMPGVLTEGTVSDPVAELTKKHLGDVVVPKRETAVEESMVGVQNLIAPAVQIEDLCKVDIQIWTRRFQLLLGIRYYSLACSEMESFSDLEGPDLFFQYYPEIYHNRKGCLVPFSLRLLHAEMPRFSGNATEALARCNHMLAIINRILNNLERGLCEDGSYEILNDDKILSEKLWKERLKDVQYCLARTLLSMKEYHLAVTVYSCIAESAKSSDEKCRIYSLLGQMKLQLGEYVSATTWFQKFNSTCDHNSPKMKALACLHKGFLCVFYGNYCDAEQAFNAALQYEPKNCDAGNNVAVCLLYQGKLSEASAVLEKLVRSNPEVALREGICTNLCTLYELASARSSGKKNSLLGIVGQNRGDSFSAACLKLT